MLKLILLSFVLYELKSAQCDYETLPEIEIIPTGVVPHICVKVDRDLPPCIGKFKEHQRKYKHQINKILQSYADMIIDYKDPKNASFENYGPGKIYLKSFESLNRELEEEEARKKLSKNGGNSSNIQDDTVVNMPEEFENQTEEETIKDLNADEPSIIQVTRVVRSLEMTVLVADQCIPLGIEFCDFTRPIVQDKKTEERIQKRSIQSFTLFKTLAPHRINYFSKNYSKLRKNVKRKQLDKTSFSNNNDDKYRKQKITELFNKLKKRK